MSGICGRRRLAALAFVSGAFGYLRGFRRFRKKSKDADLFALYAGSSQVVPSEIDDTSASGDRFYSGFLQWASIVDKEADVCDCEGETCGCKDKKRTGLAVAVGEGVGEGKGGDFIFNLCVAAMFCVAGIYCRCCIHKWWACGCSQDEGRCWGAVMCCFGCCVACGALFDSKFGRRDKKKKHDDDTSGSADKPDERH